MKYEVRSKVILEIFFVWAKAPAAHTADNNICTSGKNCDRDFSKQLIDLASFIYKN